MRRARERRTSVRERRAAGEGEQETRARLLATGLSLFAERGFHAVTVRELSQHAGANLAAVGYHFGDKLGLYTAIVESAIDKMRKVADAALDDAGDAPAGERLRRYIVNFIPRLAQPTGQGTFIMRVVRHEMRNPTPLARRIAKEGVLPHVRYLSQLVAELLGCSAEDPRVRGCVVGIQAQCRAFLRDEFRALVLTDWPPAEPAALAQAAERAADFCVAGVLSLAESPPSAAHVRRKSHSHARQRAR